MASSDLPIVLYHYEGSPYARKVVWYLNLRKIPYSQCLQPVTMPRPDVAQLGIAYRRIPLCAIGADVYLDTRLILSKLEALFPASPSHPALPTSAGGAALAYLLSRTCVDGDVFGAAAGTLLPDLVADAAFARDRAELMGVPQPGAALSAEATRAGRPEAVATVRRWVRFLEETVLGDGRAWVLGGQQDEGPSLADIEAAWILHWLRGWAGPSKLPASTLSASAAPRVWAWLDRFSEAVERAGRDAAEPKTLAGEEAARAIPAAQFAEMPGTVDAADPVAEALRLEAGVAVRVWPADYGAAHKEAGKLVSLDADEVVLQTAGQFGTVRVHAPRRGFKIARDGGAPAKM
ncbi:glutathione S-transferase [Xylariomycetidae sp. FL0641]|nr:glutathione S-transferase [Xylariomycetidae sp. FL0641]